MASSRLAGRNLALLILLGGLWGTAFMFITVGLGSFSPFLFAAFRFDIAGGALLLIALWRRSSLWPKNRAQWLAISIAAALNVASYHALLFWGQRFTSPTVAAVIVGLNPVLTTVFSTWLLSDERIGWHGVVGLVLGFFGILALATLRPDCPFIGSDPAGSVACLTDARGLGELAIVGAVASWAMGSILVRKTRHGMDLFAFTAWQMILGALILHVLSPFADKPHFAVWDLEGVASLLYLALVSSSLGFLIYFTLLERVGPIRSNLVSHIGPIFAALAGAIVLGVGLEWRALIGFVLIASGFFLVARPVQARP